MSEYPRQTADAIIAELGRRFRGPGKERNVYAVLGDFGQLDAFVPRVRELCEKNALADDGRTVAFFDLNLALLNHLEQHGKLAQAHDLADRLRNKELTRLMEENWKSWLSVHIREHLGLVLCGFELFFAYLDSNALALVRQYAINGKHMCLILPGTEQLGQVLAFYETAGYRRQITGLVPQWTYILRNGD
jgi:hypothetical protein